MQNREPDKKVPYSRKPQGISVEEWQTKLRKQFAEQQNFKFKNTGKHPVFSDFEVLNPQSGKSYKVSIRDNEKSFNFCSCPDFTINGLGTCKHIEYLLFYFNKHKKYQAHLGKKQKHNYSSLSIYYGKDRAVMLKKADSVDEFEQEKVLFDDKGLLYMDLFGELDSFILKARKKDPSFRVYPDVIDLINAKKNRNNREAVVSQIFPQGKDTPSFDSLIHTKLYPYQK
jgi:predicted nucleic acid-binding Zn finger protein